MTDLLTMSATEIKAEAKRRQDLRARNLPLSSALPVVAAKHGVQHHPQDVATIERTDGDLRMTLYGPPRTKKNHTTLGIKSHPAYKKFCADVMYQLAHFTEPLPDKAYNLDAHFFVDRYGRRADLIGLLQGLADALQAAKVVSDDKVFLGFDGSRKHIAEQEPKPRVELTITALQA